MRKLSFLLSLALIIVLGTIAPANAQFTTQDSSTPTDDKTVNCTSTPDGMDCRVDEAVAIVNLTLNDIPVKEDDQGGGGPSKYYYCLKTNPLDCGEDLKEAKSTRNAGEYTQTISFPTLCGDGDNKLKEKCTNTGADWFHPGNTYRVTIFERKDSKSPVIRDAGFYVSHFYPKVIKPAPGETSSLSFNSVKNGTSITIELQGRKNKKTGKDANKFNDYWVRVVGFDNEYKSPAGCLYIPPDGSQTGSTTIQLPKDFKDSNGNVVAQLAPGRYDIVIKEGKEANSDFTKCSEDEFAYYYIPFSIGQGGKPGKIEEAIKDPSGKENVAVSGQTQPQEVCAKEDMVDGICTKIPTALGVKISTQPQLFVRDLFTIVLSIGGIAAIAFFIQAGYTLMTSAGNKEKVGAAREQITAAIMGLIFIILSIAILEFIGVDILRIPGFTR